MRLVLYVLLAVVAGSAAVLSFDALHGLAVRCGFSAQLAPLLPVTVDAGAAAGSLVWLGRPGGRARTFGRALALVLLSGSVAGNALGHALEAYSAVPAWWVVVAVSGVPPAVLGAVVHLAVLDGKGFHPPQSVAAESPPAVARVNPAPDLSSAVVAPGPAAVDDRAHADADAVPPPADPAAGPADQITADPTDHRAAQLIAAGTGRRKLARELGVSEYEARLLLARVRETNGHAVAAGQPGT